jgi:hypothetical protein
MGGPLLIENQYYLLAGNTINIDLPNQNINNETYKILEVIYEINKKTLLSRQTLRIKVGQKLRKISEQMAEVIKDIRRLQAGDVGVPNVFTRLMGFTGSVGNEVSSWTVKTRDIGSSFILGHPVNGLLGSYANHNLGDTRSGFTTLYSGGTWN